MRLFSRPAAAPSPEPVRPAARRGVATVAHRGASARLPENTLAAVRAGIAGGADAVEVDVHRTRDGALVVLHDGTLTRTTDAARVLPGRAPWRVADLTLEEIRRLDAGSWRSPRHAGERVPTLVEVVETVRDGDAGLLLEVKTPQRYPGIVADVAAELRAVPGYLAAASAARSLVVQSFDHAAMHAFKQLAPEVPVGLLGAPPRRKLRRLARWADQVNPRHRAVGAGYVAAVHDAGLACQVWTVDEVADLARAVALGVDGIITNRPEVLTGLLRDRLASVA